LFENNVSVSSGHSPINGITELDIRTRGQGLRVSISDEMVANVRNQDLVRNLEEQIWAQFSQQEVFRQRNEEPETLTAPLFFNEPILNNGSISLSEQADQAQAEYVRETLSMESHIPIFATGNIEPFSRTVEDNNIRGSRSNFVHMTDREVWHSSRVFEDYDNCRGRRESELKKAIREEIERVTRKVNKEISSYPYSFSNAIVLLSPEAYEMLVDSGEQRRGERTINVLSPNTSVIVPGLTDLFKVIPQGDKWYREDEQ